MATLQQLRDDLTLVQSSIVTAKGRLSQAEIAYNNARTTQKQNTEAIYIKKRLALWGGVKNEYHCPTLFSPGSKREACTHQLNIDVQNGIPISTSYNATLTSTNTERTNAKNSLDGLETREATLLDQIKNEESRATLLAEKGLTPEAVLETERTLATSRAQVIEAEAQTKRTRNLIFGAVGLIVVIAIAVVVYRKIKKKGVK